MREKDTPVLKGQNKMEGELSSGAQKKKVTQKSPTRRVRRLKKSRNSWKDKNKESKKKIKSLEVKTRDVTASRDSWKDRSNQMKAELKMANDRLAQLEEAPPKKID